MKILVDVNFYFKYQSSLISYVKGLLFFTLRQCWRQLSSATGLFMFAVACSDSIRRTRESAVYTGTVFTFL